MIQRRSEYREENEPATRGGAGRAVSVFLGAALMTALFFSILPFIQAISKPPKTDLVLRNVGTTELPPPAPPQEEPEKEEENPEKEPPPMMEEAPPLDLNQLEAALNSSLQGRWVAGDFGSKLKSLSPDKGNMEALFSLSDLDQKPRAIFQPSPVLDDRVRRSGPGKVYVIFIVNTRGEVENPMVQKSTNPVFEKPALAAIKKWKFEPGKRNGKPVPFRMRVPIVFPKW